MITPTVEKVDKTVTRISIMADTGKDLEYWLLLRSDAHHDNALCRRDLEKRDLDQAVARGAGIIDIGDLLDVMQSKFDPRADRSQLRSENLANAYFDSVIDEAANFYEPYAMNWLFMSPGNHETAVVDRHGTSVTDRLADQLRWRSNRKSPVTVGTYQGWIQVKFDWGCNHRQTFNIRYTHGYGGGGPVTKDVIQANRQLAYTENADFLVSGHVHESWHMIQPREYLDNLGLPKLREVSIIKLGTYKDEFTGGQGWAVGKGHPPKPIGGWWIHFTQRDNRIHYRVIRTDGL